MKKRILINRNTLRILKSRINKDISLLKFEDNSYNSENIFEISIKNNFAGWYGENEIKKKSKFIIEKCGLKKSMRLLDVACGHGEYTEYLTKYGCIVSGTDISRNLISYLKSKYPNIAFYRKRMEEMTFNQEFDCAIIIGNSMSLIKKKDCRSALKRMYNGISSNGKIVIELDNKSKYVKEEAGKRNWNYYENRWLILSEHYFDNKKSLEKTRDVGIDFKSREVDVTIFVKQLYDKKEFVAMLKDAGFSIIAVYGDWDGDKYTIESECMIFVAKK